MKTNIHNTPENSSTKLTAKQKNRGMSTTTSILDTLQLVFQAGGPGFCQFAINNVCNANCGFCNFARDTFPKEQTQFVGLDEGLDSINILFREGIRYLVFTGGEPTLNPNLITFVDHAAGLGIKPMVVTNGGLLTPSKIHELADAGLSSLIISVDAATEEIHEKNRGLPGVCNKIKEANQVLKYIGMYSTASVTMSHLVDYDALPDFLTSLGFESVVFSYPLTKLDSNFLGFSDAGLVTHTNESLWQAYEKVKQLKKKFHVVNPTLSLEEMQRFVQDEEQHYPCLAGYRFFFLDWDLNLWRCHFWHEPMCSIYEFDSSKLVRDGCTKCMINCYRDSSLMQNIAVSMQDAYQSIKKGKLLDTAKALTRKGNVDSLRAVMEELPWIMRF
ncbi:MAG: radical SAM protein [Okeania sp. SIO3H1]|nr:radical SAM protein [Okeania sp. SIO3H1]